MNARRWDDIKAEAMLRQPWLATEEAEAERAEIHSENLRRIRGHEPAERPSGAGSPAGPSV
jgi:hypothetical protein